MQVDEKRACPSCRAENPTGAQFCWQCFASLADLPAPPGAPGRPGRGPSGLARGLGQPDAPATHVPAPPGGSFPPSTPDLAPASSGSGLVLRVVLGAIGAVLGYLLVTSLMGGGVAIPETLGGLPRQTNETAQDFESEMHDEGDRWNLDVHAATYGRSSFPETMLILVEGSSLETTDELFDALIGGMTEAGATVDAEDGVSGTHDGAEYRCVPVSGPGVEGSACIWHADDHVGIVMDLGNGAGSAEALIAEAHTAVTA